MRIFEPRTVPELQAVAVVTLGDGARVEVRAVEPTDTTLLEEVLEHMSPDSRYRRFLTLMERLDARQYVGRSVGLVRELNPGLVRATVE